MTPPHLCIVPLTSLVVHETVDPDRIDRLKRQFRKSRILKNPPLVAFAGKKFVVLDGANRVTVARQLRYRDFLVQVVDYKDPSVQLLTWGHVLDGVQWESWWKTVQHVCDERLVPLSSRCAAKLLARGALLAVIYSARGEVFGVKKQTDKTERDHLALWNVFVETYKGKYHFYRTVERDWEHVRALYLSATALITFPSLQKKDILQWGRSRATIPSGISRHVIPGRALHVDVPFSVLRSRQSLVKKNAWLERFIEQRKQHNGVRYYSEPIYLYDE